MCNVKPGSIYILATCYAGSDILADILIDKGASIVIGWDSNVTIQHADMLLQRLIEVYSQTRNWTLTLVEIESQKTMVRDPITGAMLRIVVRG